MAGSPPNQDALMSSRASSASNRQEPWVPLKVVIMGASGVGKTGLTAQFMTSEYLNTYETSLGIYIFKVGGGGVIIEIYSESN